MNAHSPIIAEPTRLAVPKKDWGAALGALQRLLRDKDATEEVFEIMRALNGDSTRKGYQRLLATAEGGRLAYNREELAQKLADRAWLATLPPGSLGAVYRDFTDDGGVTPQGLVDVSSHVMMDLQHPVAWFGRRIRDSHDLWHVTTGYGLDSLGEACLVAFSYAADALARLGRHRGRCGAEKPPGAGASSPTSPPSAKVMPAARRPAGCRRRIGRRCCRCRSPDVRARLGLAPAAVYQSIPVEHRGNAVPKG